jgi:hypothetical protein
VGQLVLYENLGRNVIRGLLIFWLIFGLSGVAWASEPDDPGETIPLILQTDSATHGVIFETHDQSMWENGNPPRDSDLEILPSQSLYGSAGFDESTTFEVPYIESVVDFFGADFDADVTVGAALDAASDGHIGLRSELSNFGDGTVDVRYPEVVVFDYPTANTFWAGDNLQLGTDSTPSGSAYLRTTPPPVEFSLIFDLVLEETLSGGIDYGFDSSDFSETTIIDVDGDDTAILHLNKYEGWYSDTSAYPPPVHPEMPFTPITQICDEVDCIKLLTGSTGYIEMPYPKPTTNGVNAQGDFVASDTNVFGNAEIDLNHASKYGKALDVDTGDIGGFEFSYKILDADISLISKVKQYLEFSPTDYIRFDFSDQVKYGGSVTNSITTLAASPVDVEFPPDRTDPITVTPTVLLKNEFHNKYVHSENNIFKVEAGTFSSEIPGVPLLSQEYSIPDLFGDWEWVCTEEVCWNPCWPWGDCRRCDCVLGYWKPEMISVGPYTTPSFDIGPFGPAYTANPSYDPEVTVVDQTFELGGFEEIPLPSFALDPQVKPYPVPIPAGRDPYEVNEGSTIVLDGSESYDLDGDPIRLYWDLDNDGVFETEGSTPSYLGTEGPGVYTIRLMANDPYGYQVAETTVTVHNVAPTVDAGSDQTVNEGDTVSISGSFTDPGWLDTHTATIEWGDGTEVESGTLTEENEYPDSTGTVTGNHAYGDNGVYTVTLTVTDDDGGVGTDTLTVTVNNVAPTASIDSMTQPNPQFILPIVHELAFDGSFTDPGWLDTHTVTWNFGDGTVEEPGTLTEENEEPDATGTTTVEHIYSDPGTYTVTLTVTDDDGGVGTDTMPVTVVDAKTANQDLNDYIQGLDDDDFKNNADQRKNALANMLMAIDAMLDKEAYQGAIQDLRNNVRGKADGLVDGHLNNDWIIDLEAQQHICMKIDDLTAYLEHLKTLEG